jgi:hypothetical protein
MGGVTYITDGPGVFRLLLIYIMGRAVVQAARLPRFKS